MALSDASREIIAQTQFFQELHITLLMIPVVLSDNQSALHIAENPTNYQRAKHIDIRYHFIRHALRNNQLSIDYIPSTHQPADVLTKALGPQIRHQLVSLMGLKNKGV